MFDIFDRMFGTMDAAFRQMEREFHCPNRLPVITIPAVKTYSVDQRAYDDGEKIQKFTNGILHCETGPAVVYHDEKKEDEYWLEGRLVTKEEVEKRKEEIEDNRMHSIWIDNKEFKVTGKRLRELAFEDKLKELEAK
jgi:mannosyltransferase OCH1-like enzyme